LVVATALKNVKKIALFAEPEPFHDDFFLILFFLLLPSLFPTYSPCPFSPRASFTSFPLENCKGFFGSKNESMRMNQGGKERRLGCGTMREKKVKYDTKKRGEGE
jgi:hypothetical protein